MLSQLNSEDFLALLVMVLLHGTALMLLTWLAGVTLLRRARPSVQSAVWTVVLIKFLLPPVLPVNVGLSGMLDSILSHAEHVLQQATPQKFSPSGQTELSMSGDDTPPQHSRWSNYIRPLPALLLFAYAGLLLLLVAKALLSSQRAGRRVRGLPVADERLTGEVAALGRRLGIRRLPQVRVDACAASPFLIGAWSPTLVMPATLPAGIKDAAREALLIHELAHIRRGDVLVRWLQNVARLVFFFWPPVWWLCRRLERYSEMACDQWAIKFSSVCPQLYAETLLEMAKSVRERALITHEVGFASRRTPLLGARFKMILEGVHVKSPRLSWQVFALVLAWSSFALTGSVFAEAEREGQVTLRVSEARSLPQSSQQTSGPGQGTHVPPSTPFVSAEVQESREERKRIEERQALARANASGGHRAVSEKLKTDALAAEMREPVPSEPARDLNGDGRISDFEAGYSAGMAYARRDGAYAKSARGLEEFKVRRGIRGVVTDRRKLEAELQLQRRKSTPDDAAPLINH